MSSGSNYQHYCRYRSSFTGACLRSDIQDILIILQFPLQCRNRYHQPNSQGLIGHVRAHNGQNIYLKQKKQTNKTNKKIIANSHAARRPLREVPPTYLVMHELGLHKFLLFYRFALEGLYFLHYLLLFYYFLPIYITEPWMTFNLVCPFYSKPFGRIRFQ